MSRAAALLAIAVFGVVMSAAGAEFLTGFRWVMGLSAGLAVLSSLSAWLLIEHRLARPGSDKGADSVSGGRR